MSSTSPDVVIVGGGIVGAACARVLAGEKIRVTLVESGTIGGGATATTMGHIVVMDDSEAQFALSRYSQQLWYEFVEDLPADCEYRQSGTMWVAADDEEMDVVRRKHHYYQQRGVTVEALDSTALAEAEPKLRPGLSGALRVPGDCVVYPPCAARWLLERARQDGAQVRTGVAVAELTADGVGLSDGSHISAARVICATGAAAAELIPGVQVHPRKGHLVITDRYPGFINHQLIELGYLKSAGAATGDSVAFNVQPRITGQLLLGSSRQYGDRTTHVRTPILNRMVDRALEYAPSLGRISAVRTWTGFRAATPDKLPLIGPWPEDERIYLATGHEGLGITTSLGTAALLADRIAGRKPAIPCEPYLPSRLCRRPTHE